LGSLQATEGGESGVNEAIVAIIGVSQHRRIRNGVPPSRLSYPKEDIPSEVWTGLIFLFSGLVYLYVVRKMRPISK
jgi:hypothetical protein